jgi:hypothetical protein
MMPIEFAEKNCVFAKDQPEYLPLPAHKTSEGEVISCWSLNLRERFKIFWIGRVWLRVLTFHNPLQPLHPTVDYPFIKHKKRK